MAKTTTRRKPGRPKGSRGTATMHGANTRCPQCRCTRKRAIRIVKERPAAGIDTSGCPYNRVVWRRVQCVNCDRHGVEIERQYDGDTL